MAPRFTYSWKFGAGFCPAAGNRRWVFSLPGKTGAVRGLAPGTSRVRARHGEARDTERDLPGAAALEKPRSKAQLFKRFYAWGGTFGPTFYIFMEVWRGLLSGRREQEVGFLPARENRNSAWAHTRNQPRACETRGEKRHGARIARRRRGLSPCPGKQKLSVGPHSEPAACVRDAGRKETRCATCPAQPRDLPTAGVRRRVRR